MSNPNRTALDALAGGVLGAILTAFVLAYTLTPGHEVTGAVVTASPCGIYNITTTHADGTITQYTEAAPPYEVLIAIDELAPEARAIVIVPCPTMQVPQREAKSQNPSDSSQARETRQTSGYDPDWPRAG